MELKLEFKIRQIVGRKDYTIFFQVLEQVGINKSLSNRILVANVPELSSDYIFLRGENRPKDNILSAYSVRSLKEAEEMLSTYISWLDEAFAEHINQLDINKNNTFNWNVPIPNYNPITGIYWIKTK